VRGGRLGDEVTSQTQAVQRTVQYCIADTAEPFFFFKFDKKKILEATFSDREDSATRPLFYFWGRRAIFASSAPRKKDK
jgi:hypothetical protein